MHDDTVIVLVISSAALFLFITSFLGYFVILYRNKQVINKQEQDKLHATFKLEILKTQLEVQEDTLSYISRELHDNINQVLSFVKLNLGLVSSDNEIISQKVSESRELIGETINDLRNLSHSLSFERIAQLGLAKTVHIEAEKLNKSGMLNTYVNLLGEEYPLGERRELVLFRIFQESVNNVLKHAAAGNLKIDFIYKPDLFQLIIKDDGKGFLQALNSEQQGNGLKNIIKRAALIGALATVESLPGLGCTVDVSFNPLTKELYADGLFSDRPGR